MGRCLKNRDTSISLTDSPDLVFIAPINAFVLKKFSTLVCPSRSRQTCLAMYQPPSMASRLSQLWDLARKVTSLRWRLSLDQEGVYESDTERSRGPQNRAFADHNLRTFVCFRGTPATTKDSSIWLSFSWAWERSGEC
jgi:hypothetical protein